MIKKTVAKLLIVGFVTTLLGLRLVDIVHHGDCSHHVHSQVSSVQ